MYIIKDNVSTSGKTVLTETEYRNLAESLKQYYRKLTQEQIEKRSADCSEMMEDLHGQQEIFDY